MFIKLKCFTFLENNWYIINVNDIAYISVSDYRNARYFVKLKSGNTFEFCEEEIQPLFDYMESNNLIINTNS